MQQITQMHKIRQQHQNFSSRFLHSNNNNTNNNNYHHPHHKGSNNANKHLQYTQQQDKQQQQQQQQKYHQQQQQNNTNATQTQPAHMAMIQQPPPPQQQPPQAPTHAPPLHPAHPTHYHHGGQPPQQQYYTLTNPTNYHLPPPPPPNALHPQQGNEGHVIVAATEQPPQTAAQQCTNKPPPLLAQQQQQQQQVFLGSNNNNHMRHYNYTTAAGAAAAATTAYPVPPHANAPPTMHIQKRANNRQQPLNRSKMPPHNNNNNTINYNNYNGHENYYNNNKNVKSGPIATVGEPKVVSPLKPLMDVNVIAPSKTLAKPTPPQALSAEQLSTSESDQGNSTRDTTFESSDGVTTLSSENEENALDDKATGRKSKNEQTAADSTNSEQENNSTSANRSNSSNILSIEDYNVTSSNGKEKTPMCLVNELARFNKIGHEYRLTSENGPAHSKRFTVTLKLGDEEYSAEGFKIKKAQHLAAAAAISKTQYKHPTPKLGRRGDEHPGSRPNITPTVELNALAMKLGQQTFYVMDATDLQRDPRGTPPLPDPEAMPPPYVLGHGPPPPGAINVGGVHVLGPPPPHPHAAMPLPSSYMRRGGGFMGPPPPPLLGPYNNYGRYNGQGRGYPGGPGGRHALMSRHHMGYAPVVPQIPTKITLYVGEQKFIGTGRTLQQAKHDAAGRALEVLKVQAEAQKQDSANQSEHEEGCDLKSPISMVHELAIRRGMTILFKVLREEGPAHMKNFVTACICGTIMTEGEGNGKRISKKRAAEKMLSELRKLPPLTPTVTPVKRGGRMKTKAAASTSGGSHNTSAVSANEKTAGGGGARKRLTKEPSDADNDINNPITCLIQLQQARKEKEPEFILIGKNGNETARRREFIYEVAAEGMTARGLGTSKKLAKRSAAENLLKALGVEVPVAAESAKKMPPTEPKQTPPKAAAKKSNNDESDANTDTSKADESEEATGGTAQVPGILILRQPKKKTETPKKKEKAAMDEPPQHEESVKPVEVEVVEAVKPTEKERPKSANEVQSKQQLLYLANILDFEVAFSDYPKGNHGEFLTIVTLTTNPPQICHGFGGDLEESQNDASRNALRILSALGIGSSTN